MHAAHDRDFASPEGRQPFYVSQCDVAPERARYGTRQANLPAVAAILAGHAALLALLVTTDVLPLRKPVPKPLVVELLPEAQPPPQTVPAPPVEPPVVAPPTVVHIATPAPPELVVVDEAPPVVALPTVAASPTVNAPAPVATVPMPVTPPDFSAAYLHNPSPRYPLESRREKEQGTVRIKVLVSAEGSVDEIKIASSSGSDRLDRAALEAVRRWSFAPATQAGRAVAAWVIVPIPFVLKG